MTVINYADHAIGLEIKCLINVYFFEPPADSPHLHRQSPVQFLKCRLDREEYGRRGGERDMPVRVNLQLERPLVGEGAITSSTPR